MELQKLAVEKIDLISKSLDALVKKYGFTVKVRDADTSIFKEYLGYEKGRLVIDIVVCLHPHDYPYFLSVTIRDKEPNNYKRASITQLSKLSKGLLTISEEDLPISTDDDMHATIAKLVEALEIILKNELYKAVN